MSSRARPPPSPCSACCSGLTGASGCDLPGAQHTHSSPNPHRQAPDAQGKPGSSQQWQRLAQKPGQAPCASCAGALHRRFSAGVPREFLKRATPGYAVRGSGLFSLRLTDQKRTTPSTTTSVRRECHVLNHEYGGPVTAASYRPHNAAAPDWLIPGSGSPSM